MKLIQQLLEIAAKGEGRYGSAQAINAKFAECSSCGARIEKAKAFHGGAGRFICNKCHTGQD